MSEKLLDSLLVLTTLVIAANFYFNDGPAALDALRAGVMQAAQEGRGALQFGGVK